MCASCGVRSVLGTVHVYLGLPCICALFFLGRFQHKLAPGHGRRRRRHGGPVHPLASSLMHHTITSILYTPYGHRLASCDVAQFTHHASRVDHAI
jgi:hypothetical protein